MSKRSRKKGHARRHRITRHDQTKAKASKALEVLEAMANVHIRKWQRRFILACFCLTLALGSMAWIVVAALNAL